jgi:hypothetical protein
MMAFWGISGVEALGSTGSEGAISNGIVVIGAERIMVSFAAGAIHWVVAAWNRRTNLSVMSVLVQVQK